MKRKKRKIWQSLLQLAGLAFLLFVLLVVVVLIIFFRELPRPEKFSEGLITQSTKIFDRTGQVLLYEISGQEKRTAVPLGEIPEYLKEAVLTAEDRRFYEHQGVEFKAIIRALLYDFKVGRRAQGASTISQQLIRSYFLSQDKTIQRKTREVILTLELERRYSKDQIFEWYLNLIPFGSNWYGVETASQAIFNKSVREITLAQSALLAALIRAPSALSPLEGNLEKLLSLQKNLLDEMARQNLITEEEAARAKEEELVFSQTKNPIKAPHFVMYIKQYLEEKYGQNYLTRAGLEVITTLDVDLQEKAELLVKEKAKEMEIYNAHNAGLVAINPKNGEVLAMVGSKDYFGQSYPQGCSPGLDCLFDPQVNVALANRQPGSAFKPFAYAAAMQKGLLPQTLIWDVQTEFNLNCLPDASQAKDKYSLDCYHPRNYDGQYKGLISLREALAQSRNLPAVKVLYLAGLSETIQLAQKLGLTTLADESRYGLALVLGGGEVKLLEMTAAYAVFANDGIKHPTTFIQQITDQSGRIIEKAKPASLKVLSSQTVRLLNDVLSDNKARAPLFGWNSLLNIEDYDVAVKTGTTQQFNDAWAVGYSPAIAVGVWVGNNDNSPTLKPGVSLAGPLWNPFMKYALTKFSKEEFAPPQAEERDKPMLNGERPEEVRSLLHFIDKKNPLGEMPNRTEKDKDYLYWEFAIRRFLRLPQTTTTNAAW